MNCIIRVRISWAHIFCMRLRSAADAFDFTVRRIWKISGREYALFSVPQALPQVTYFTILAPEEIWVCLIVKSLCLGIKSRFLFFFLLVVWPCAYFKPERAVARNWISWLDDLGLNAASVTNHVTWLGSLVSGCFSCEPGNHSRTFFIRRLWGFSEFTYEKPLAQ